MKQIEQELYILRELQVRISTKIIGVDTFQEERIRFDPLLNGEI